MLDNSGIFAFDTDFENNGKVSVLEVFVKYNKDHSHYYYCVIDDKHEYVFAKGDDGEWIDSKIGKTDLARQVGAIIENKLRGDIKSTID